MLVYPRRMREGDKVFATMLGLFFYDIYAERRLPRVSLLR